MSINPYITTINIKSKDKTKTKITTKTTNCLRHLRKRIRWARKIKEFIIVSLKKKDRFNILSPSELGFDRPLPLSLSLSFSSSIEFIPFHESILSQNQVQQMWLSTSSLVKVNGLRLSITMVWLLKALVRLCFGGATMGLGSVCWSSTRAVGGVCG